MKIKLCLAFLFVVAYLAMNAQAEPNTVKTTGAEDKSVSNTGKPAAGEDEIFTVVEVAPEYPGGMMALYTFIAQNVRYPQKEKEAGIQGKVYVRFVVEKDGSIDHVEVIKGVTDGKGLDDEAVRVIKTLPAWAPGKQAGKAVRVYYNLPIKFALDK